MKKIILAILLCIPLMISAQAVSKGSVYFYADSTSTQINLERNEFLSGLIIPTGRIDSLLFTVYDSASEAWYQMVRDSVDYSIQIDSSKSVYIPLDRDKFHSIKTLKLIIDAAPADTFQVYYDKRSY